MLNRSGRVAERPRLYAKAEQALRQRLAIDSMQAGVVQHGLYLRAKQCKWPARRAALRQHLHQTRGRCALFDTERYTRHLEDAFTLMWLRHTQGLAPADIEVPARA